MCWLWYRDSCALRVPYAHLWTVVHTHTIISAPQVYTPDNSHHTSCEHPGVAPAHTPLPGIFLIGTCVRANILVQVQTSLLT